MCLVLQQPYSPPSLRPLPYSALNWVNSYVNILGGSIHMVKGNAEALVAATKEIGLEVNADKTKYKIGRASCRERVSKLV
jgi:hypothetical protein